MTITKTRHPGTGAVNRTVSTKIAEQVSVLDFIPVVEHAAIAANTSTYDATADFNAALAAAKTVHVPAGTYFITRPLNMSGRRTANTYQARQLIGEGASNTIINAYTGNYPIIDLTGSSLCTVQGINFRSDNPPVGLAAADCASVGLLIRRGATTAVCHQARLIDLRFNMTSAIARNGGIGTVGIVNCGGEHLVADQIQIYANIPLVIHNVLQFTISNSSDIPTYGTSYEQPYAGAAVSCTIQEWRSMQLIAYDSFRAIWMNAVGEVSIPALYTSTRYLVSLVPAYTESFHITDSANVTIDCYQEVSGLFGATYRMDHRYLTIGGVNTNMNVQVQRGALDMGFTNPGVSAPSIMLLNGAYLNGGHVNCNYLIGTYNASGDNNGFANDAVSITGTPSAVRNVTFTLDSVLSRAGGDIFATFGTYCYNVQSQNFLSGVSYYGNVVGSFTPTVIGMTAAGVGTYTLQTGTYSKSGRTCTFTIDLGWSAHTGTGLINVGGLPYAVGTAVATFSVYYDGYTAGAGKQMQAIIPGGGTAMYLVAADQAGGAAANLGLDTAVARLVISGSYRIA